MSAVPDPGVDHGAAAGGGGPGLLRRTLLGGSAFVALGMLLGSGTMRELTIDLQEGFFDDRVVVRAGGEELASAEDVTTRVQLGFARSLEVALAAGAREVEIEVPTRDLRAAIRLDPATHPYLGVSITRDGRLETRLSATPFGYL